MSNAARDPLNRVSPLIVAAAAVAVLCAMDVTIKHLVRTNDVWVVTFGRYLFACIFAGALYLHAGRPGITTEMLRAHSLRGVVIAVAASTFFWSLTVLPLAEAIAIAFIAPLLIPFVARLILKEKLRPESLAAAGVGFVGVLITIQGAPALDHAPLYRLGVIAVLASAAAYALSITLLRGRAGRDPTPVIVLLSAAIPGLLVLGPAAVTGSLPPVGDLPWFFVMGLCGAVGMFLLTKAYARAEAQQLAPIEYTGLLWAALFGYVFFAEVPRVQVWLGAGVIIAACLFAAWSERRTSLQSVSPAGPGAGG